MAPRAAGSAPAPLECEGVGPGTPNLDRHALAMGGCLGHMSPAHCAGRCGREAEGGGLLNRYRVVKLYRGFESLRLRQLLPSPSILLLTLSSFDILSQLSYLRLRPCLFGSKIGRMAATALSAQFVRSNPGRYCVATGCISWSSPARVLGVSIQVRLQLGRPARPRGRGRIPFVLQRRARLPSSSGRSERHRPAVSREAMAVRRRRRRMRPSSGYVPRSSPRFVDSHTPSWRARHAAQWGAAIETTPSGLRVSCGGRR